MSTLSASNFYQISSIQLEALGAKYSDALGRSWRYALAGAVNLLASKLSVEADVVTTHQNMSFTVAPAIGDTVVRVTLGATNAATANQYRGGTLTVVSGTGLAQSYGVAANAAGAAATSIEVTLTEPIRIAGAISQSNVNLATNKFSGVVISVSDQLDVAVGVQPVAITAAYYGYIQTGGQGAVLIDETIAIGQAVTIGSSTAGAVEAADAAGEQIVGTMGPTGGVDTEYDNVIFNLDTPDR